MKWKAIGTLIWESHASGDFLVATCHRPGHREDDARIVAAAPEMVDLLRAVKDEVHPARWEEISATFEAHGIDL